MLEKPTKLLKIVTLFHILAFITFFFNQDAYTMLISYWLMFDVALILYDQLDWEVWAMWFMLLRVIFLCVAQQLLGLNNIHIEVIFVYLLFLILWFAAVTVKIYIQDWWWNRNKT